MSLLFLSSRTAAGLVLVAAAWLSGGMARAQDTGLPVTENGPNFVATSTLFPGGGVAPAQDPHVTDYEGNPQHIAEGERLFNWYNCSGCHFHGGGGMGPPLMDNKWRYGGKMEDIVASILYGRPNGMPDWRNKITQQQAWELAAYVHSLSGAVRKDAVSARSDAMATTP